MINSVKKEVRIGLRKSDEIHWKIEKNASMQKCKYADIEKCFIFYSRLNFLAHFRSTYYGAFPWSIIIATSISLSTLSSFMLSVFMF